jgi:IS6 family transposase
MSTPVGIRWRIDNVGCVVRAAQPRQVKYLNNIFEQDHRNFGGFWTARRTLAGYKTMVMIRKGQVRNIDGRDIKNGTL